MLWSQLFATPMGLLSVGTLVFIFVMMGYILRFALKHMHEDEAAHRGDHALHH